jgi:hypothetical protein
VCARRSLRGKVECCPYSGCCPLRATGGSVGYPAGGGVAGPRGWRKAWSRRTSSRTGRCSTGRLAGRSASPRPSGPRHRSGAVDVRGCCSRSKTTVNQGLSLTLAVVVAGTRPSRGPDNRSGRCSDNCQYLGSGRRGSRPRSADGTLGSLDARLRFGRMSGRSVVVPRVRPHDLVFDHGALAGHRTDKWGVSDLVGGAGATFGAG